MIPRRKTYTLSEAAELTGECGEPVGLVTAQIVDAGQRRRAFGAGRDSGEHRRELAGVAQVDVGPGHRPAAGDDEVVTVPSRRRPERLEQLGQGRTRLVIS